jgi:hypothetical protein
MLKDGVQSIIIGSEGLGILVLLRESAFSQSSIYLEDSGQVDMVNGSKDGKRNLGAREFERQQATRTGSLQMDARAALK